MYSIFCLVSNSKSLCSAFLVILLCIFGIWFVIHCSILLFFILKAIGYAFWCLGWNNILHLLLILLILQGGEMSPFFLTYFHWFSWCIVVFVFIQCLCGHRLYIQCLCSLYFVFISCLFSLLIFWCSWVYCEFLLGGVWCTSSVLLAKYWEVKYDRCGGTIWWGIWAFNTFFFR